MTESEPRRLFESCVNETPPTRQTGLRYANVVLVLGTLALVWTLATACLLSLGGAGSRAGDQAFRVRSAASLGVLLVVLRFLWTRADPRYRMPRQARARYPLVWKTASALQTGPEVLRGYLVPLQIDGDTLFIVDYRIRSDRHLQRPSSSLLVSVEGDIIEDEALFERAYSVLSLAYVASFGSQAVHDQQTSELRGLQRKSLPKWRRALETNKNRFVGLGASESIDSILRGWDDMLAYGVDRKRIHAFERACVRAIGYGFFREVLEEDANRLARAGFAFADLAEREHMVRAAAMSSAAEILTSVMVKNSGWRRPAALQNALVFLRGYRGALHEAMDSFRARAYPSDEVWRSYREGLALARRLGVPIRTPTPANP